MSKMKRSQKSLGFWDFNYFSLRAFCFSDGIEPKKNGRANSPISVSTFYIDYIDIFDLLTLRHVENRYIRIEGRIVEDPREQYIVQKNLSLGASGLKTTAIAQKLNDLKVRSGSSKLWDHSSVRSVLMFTLYTGDIV
jgi:hypothetical protein